VKPFVAPRAEEVVRVRRLFGVTDGLPLLLSVGRLSREKGHLDLVRAIARLRDKGVLCRLVVVGDGPERLRIERLCRTLEIATSIMLAGHRDDVAPLYAAADLLVLPSYTEGSPNVLLEAMAAALPIVATSVGGVPEMIQHDTSGVLVDPRAPDSMAAAIQRVLRDEEFRLRLGRNAQQESSRFSPAAYCDSILRLYDSLVRSRATPAIPEP